MNRMIYQYFFTTLGINLRKYLHFHSIHTGRQFRHGSNGFLFIAFNAYNDAFDGKIGLQSTESGFHIVSTLYHGQRIACDVRFALRTVDNQLVHTIGIRIPFYMGRESGAAQSDYATVTDRLNQIFAAVDYRCLQRITGCHSTVGFNGNSGNRTAGG